MNESVIDILRKINDPAAVRFFFQQLARLYTELEQASDSQKLIVNIRQDQYKRISAILNQRIVLSIRADKDHTLFYFMMNPEDSEAINEMYGVVEKETFKNPAADLLFIPYSHLQGKDLSLLEESWLRCCKEYEPKQNTSVFKEKHVAELYELAFDNALLEKYLERSAVEKPLLNLSKLREHIQHFIQNLDQQEHPDDNFQERENKMQFYQSWTAERLLQMTAEELYDYLSKLWAMLIWSKKQYAIDKFIASSGLETIRLQLADLLYGPDTIDERWDNFRRTIKGIGQAMMSELLCHTHPTKYLIWNRRAHVALRHLEMQNLPRYDSQISGQAYKQLCEQSQLIADELAAAGFTEPAFEAVDFFVWKELQVEDKLSTAFDKNKAGTEDEQGLQLEELEMPVSSVGETDLLTTTDQTIQYWWLNANPSIWKISDTEAGQIQTYTTHNDKGNKRNIYRYFLQVKPGDLVIGYESNPVKRVKAVFEITKGAHLDEEGDELISFRVKELLPNEPSWEELQQMPELEGSEIMRNNQGSLFRLTEHDFSAIYNRAKGADIAYAPYTIAQARLELFLPDSRVEEISRALRYKKNIILQGPPGVGKTYVAKRLAYLQMGHKDEARVQMVQFHQSYAYEDFIRGFRPNEQGNFELSNGVFYEFCHKALNDPDREYFFVIDEINRGNLSKIFGELMMLLEADKRDPEYAMPLTYHKPGEPKFYLPRNLYLIGTMNTADRSLAMVDYALRRRFMFIELEPELRGRFQEHLSGHQVPLELREQLVSRIEGLNKTIKEDKNLGSGFQIGHSYFCQSLPKGTKAEDWYQQIVELELKPMLEEYWFDQPEKARQEVEALLAG